MKKVLVNEKDLEDVMHAIKDGTKIPQRPIAYKYVKGKLIRRNEKHI